MPDLALPLLPTVTVMSPDPRKDVCIFAVTFTVVSPAASPTLEGLTDSVIGLVDIALVNVRLVPVTVWGELPPSTEIVSFSSVSFLSELGIRLNVAVPVVSPLSMVSVKSFTVG